MEDKTYDDRYPNALALGTILNGQYKIEKVLGQGGFGITYLGIDLNLELKVAIKEYYPEGLVTRSRQQTGITVFGGDKEEAFQMGVASFLEEAKILAKFQNNKHIVGVKTFFRENGTTYFVMDYIEGISFKDYLKQMGGKILVDDVIGLLEPIMEALQEVHQTGLLHRDISPDNIYITHQGESKLLDFGAARYNLGEKSRSLSVILKPGYAPEEQYRSKGKQGPWTDVYALAATMYFAITGNLPPESLDRLEQDDLQLPSEKGIAINASVEGALVRALEVKAVNRFQTVGAFQKALVGQVQVKEVVETKNDNQDKQVEAIKEENKVEEVSQLAKPSATYIRKSKKNIYVAIGAIGIGILALGVAQGTTANDDKDKEAPPTLEIVQGEANGGVKPQVEANPEEVKPPVVEEETTPRFSWAYKSIGQWDYIGTFQEGVAVARRGDFTHGDWFFIDTNGNIVCDAQDFGYRFSQGLAEVQVGDGESAKWGYIDKSGGFVIPPIWDDAYGFKEDVARVVRMVDGEEQWEFINPYGQRAIPMTFPKAQDFQEGMAAVQSADMNPGKWGFINEWGDTKIGYFYGDTYGFSEGLAPVKEYNDKWGMINKAGEEVIPAVWEELYPLEDGLAAAKDPYTGKWGYIDAYGELMIAAKWDKVKSFQEGYAAVCKVEQDKERWGLIDINGNEVIPPMWDKAQSPQEGLITVVENGKYKVIEID